MGSNIMTNSYQLGHHQSLALLTDFYQLTMAYGFWKLGMGDREATFHLFFRKKPFQGNFAIAAGLETAISFIENFSFEESDLNYLATLKRAKGKPFFDPKFLDYLAALKLECNIDAVKEGTPIFPHEPIIRVQGPLLQAQLLESPLLNIINYQTLIATKASRVCLAAEGDEVIEFGLRRAQGMDGALSGSRAAYIGGCHATSNVLAGKYYGIPVKGTHAHSWIMAFKEEKEAFTAYSRVMPEGGFYLVDTYRTLDGVKKAIQVAQDEKVVLQGVRLDSGDLAYLSIEIRKLLDQAGFKKAKIMASNELDENLIRDLKKQGCQVSVWGVGTHLITGKEQSALDGVYKLGALRHQKGGLDYKIKISEQRIKTTNPGILQIRRYYDQFGCNQGDVIYDAHLGIAEKVTAIDPIDPSLQKKFLKADHYRDLLIPIFRQGKRVYDPPSIHEVRKGSFREIQGFSSSIKRFLYPQTYFVGLERKLDQLKRKLLEKNLKRPKF